ncbi:ABC transporter permease [Pacificitalea manganoxidans]|uniref:ABC transporter permease n=1 Tax=Pacificitalea manganoxidans TaxID=1411902 RepID=A0A291LW85_9RHOB|nr:energy-coupling factor transporter transmembrane component T [Pacificitalea manganoxidans]ATI40914.1 ABC transporter permease [Pacificitalea manganoxidans]MDR6308259.1 biotin transport system permease protein [Pacificitalea manganoxidans]
MLALTSPVRTPFHRVPAGAKLLGLAGFTFGVALIDAPALMLPPLALVAVLYAICGARFAVSGLRALKPLWIFVAVILVWHALTDDLARGAMLAARILATVALANLVTMTTRLEDLIAVVDTLLRPLERLGLRPGLIGFAIALVLRFTPVLLDKGRALAEAWRARSPRRAGWRVVIPLTLVTLDDAEHVAEALKARGGVPARSRND